MRILFVHPRLGVLGGAERVLVHMLGALRDNDLSLISDDWCPQRVNTIFDIEPPEIEWIRCASFRPLLPHFQAFHWLYYARKIDSLIQKMDRDCDLLIETQQVYSDPGRVGRLVSYIHYPSLAAPPPEKEKSIASSIYYAILRSIVLRRVGKISLALTNSPFTARKVVEYLKIRPLVVPPPVDVRRFYSDRSWSDREDKVVSIGTFLPFKRHHLLLQVARKLPEIRFVIMGTLREDHRSYYEKLCKQKSENVTIMQDVALDAAAKELASAKVYVHLCPEHFGISVVEAAAAGCVPIVYEVGGPAECLGDAAIIWKDLDHLRSCIIESVTDGYFWSKMSDKARNAAFEFDASIFEQRIKNIVEGQLWKK